MQRRIMHLQVLLLASAQALFQTASVLVMTIGGLAGALITSRPELATLPIATMFLGTAVITFPASIWMTRVGRRVGFILGALLGPAGGLIAANGVWMGSLALLSTGTFLVGAFQAFAQFYRFATSEVADEAFRPRAISLVLAGGIVAAFAGPWLGRLGGLLMQPEYVDSFLLLTPVSMLGAAIMLPLQVPDAKHEIADGATVRPWRAIVLQPTYLVALFGAATGYGIMIVAMTATPIAMLHHKHDLATAATVVQLHVLGMFLPSFFTGSLIARVAIHSVVTPSRVVTRKAPRDRFRQRHRVHFERDPGMGRKGAGKVARHRTRQAHARHGNCEAFNGRGLDRQLPSPATQNMSEPQHVVDPR